MAHRPVVLIVDDDASMRTLLCELVGLHGGFRIGGAAEDGLEGALMAADVNPDVVIMDYFMPRWDGCRAAEFIRSHCKETKIVAFSAALTELPTWADGLVFKTDVHDLMPVVEQMVGAAAA